MNIFQYIEQERDDAFFEPGETQPPLPTGSPIGSPERVEAYAQRVAKGQPIFVRGDSSEVYRDASRPGPKTRHQG